MPSEDEWYKAAYYKGGGTNAGYWDYPTCSDSIDLSMANYEWFPGHTTNVGSYANTTAYGTFDQGGNVYEWNEAVLYPGDYYGRGVRGGSLGGTDSFLRASIRGTAPPQYEYYHIGFRVASIPEPSSVLVLLCGLGGMMWRRAPSGGLAR